MSVLNEGYAFVYFRLLQKDFKKLMCYWHFWCKLGRVCARRD